jgi:hypothetical protein
VTSIRSGFGHGWDWRTTQNENANVVLCKGLYGFSSAYSVMALGRGGSLARPPVILRCALLRASKDEYGPPCPILRGSLRSHLRMISAPIRLKAIML